PSVAPNTPMFAPPSAVLDTAGPNPLLFTRHAGPRVPVIARWAGCFAVLGVPAVGRAACRAPVPCDDRPSTPNPELDWPMTPSLTLARPNTAAKPMASGELGSLG